MKYEHDDEATTFDPMPWGAQQRVQPRHTFRRVSAALESDSIAAIPPLRMMNPVFTPVATRAPAPVAPPYPVFAIPMHDGVADVTMRVRRPAYTLRSVLAVPIGAVLALVLILLVHGGGESSARAAGHVSLPVAEPVTEPVPEPVIEPMVASVAAPAAERAVPAPPAYEPTVPAVQAPTPVATKPSKRAHRPRKIVAVDASTPLGNLRPRRW